MADTIIYDALLSAENGMDSGKEADVIGKSQYSRGVNVTNRDGKIKTRPPLDFIDRLVFERQSDKNIFLTGKFQGGTYYNSLGRYCLICVVSGVIFRIYTDTFDVENVSNSIGFQDQLVNRNWFLRADRFFIIQDGINAAVILDGTSASRSDPLTYGIPTGTMMAFSHSRIFVAVGGRYIIAGDILQAQDPTTCLYFKEQNTLNLGGALVLPVQVGPKITGMGVLQNTNSQTGVGPLVATGSHGIVTFNVQIPRADWRTTAGLEKIIVIGPGNESHSSMTNINNDLFFRSVDAIRSYRSADAMNDLAFAGNTPISLELNAYIDMDTGWLVNLAEGVLFQNRLLMSMVAAKTLAKLRNGDDVEDYYFSSMASLNFEAISNLQTRPTPAWEGVWTGVNPMSIVQFVEDGVDRCFVFSKDIGSYNALYEFGDGFADNDDTIDIETMVATRSMMYQNADGDEMAFQPKRLTRTELYLSEVKGDIKIEQWVSADFTRKYTFVGQSKLCAPMEVTIPLGVESDEDIPDFMDQIRPFFLLPQPTLENDPITCSVVTFGYGIQLLLKITGFYRLQRLRVQATAEVQVQRQSCKAECTALSQTGIDYFSYQIAERAP